MNIYKLINPHQNDYSHVDNSIWEIYIDAVVYAETEEQARNIHPDEEFGEFYKGVIHDPNDEWCFPSEVIVEFLGTNEFQKKAGVITTSSRM